MLNFPNNFRLAKICTWARPLTAFIQSAITLGLQIQMAVIAD